jgi:predicted nucleic acid-binding protein
MPGRRRDQNRRILAVLLREVRIRPLEPSIAPLYVEIYHELRDHGRVLSLVDMTLAALSRSMGATLLTSDRDSMPSPTSALRTG